MKLKITLKESLQIQKNYFSDYGKEIALRNLNLMKTVSYCGIFLYLTYYVVTFLFFRTQMISLVYALIVPVLILFLFWIRKYLQDGEVTFKKTQMLTILMYLVMLGYCIVMSVFAHPELNAVYYPLFLVMGPVMFILPLYQQFLLNVGSYILFFIFEMQVKTEAIRMHDLFETFTALIFSWIVILLMTQFRVQSDQLKSKYYSLSRQDGLTGILNKTAGTELIQSYVEHSVVQEPFALALFDVDDFKSINDTYGHEAGDEVLRTFGQLLSNAFRKDDIVSRYGGDEFLILLKNITKADAENKIRNLEDMVSKCIIQDKITISTSIGICTGICGKDQFETTLKKADKELYLIKQQGKHSHGFYQGEDIGGTEHA